MATIIVHNMTGDCRQLQVIKYWSFVLSVTMAKKALAALGAT